MKYFLELSLSDCFVPIAFVLICSICSVFIYVITRVKIKRKLTQIRLIDTSFNNQRVEDKSETVCSSFIISSMISLVVIAFILFMCSLMTDQQKTVISSHTYEHGKDYAFYYNDETIFGESQAAIRKIVNRDKFERAIANNDNTLLIEDSVIDNYSENGLSSTDEYPKQSEIDNKYDEVLLNVKDSRKNDDDVVNRYSLVIKEVEIKYFYKHEKLNAKKLVLEVTKKID